MTQEEREQLLKDTLLYFSRHNRYVTDENGNKYYREDVTLKAMELSETPLLPAKGVTAEEFLKGCKHDGSYIPVSEVIRLMNEFAAQQQPTAEGAEEILTNLETYYDFKFHWIERDRMIRAMHEFATLHAQKIADKMVGERLREELMTYDKFLSNTYWGISHITKREEAVNEYLKSREK